MEYDTSASQGIPESKNYPHDSTAPSAGEGKLRVRGEKVDVSILKESITFPFSGRVAKNRFLKAPMTERLCSWNKEGEDIVRATLLPFPPTTPIPYRPITPLKSPIAFPWRPLRRSHPPLPALGRR
jgi:hypothetical protein